MSDDDGCDAEMAPVLAVSYFDSLTQMRGQVAEIRDELALRFADDEAPAPLRGLVFEPAYVALRIDVDAGLECAVALYPLVSGVHYPDLGETSEALFQLGDDGGGMVDPGQLWSFFEYLLDDVLPLVGCDNRQDILERFAGGERPLALCDPIGNLLALPGSDMDAW